MGTKYVEPFQEQIISAAVWRQFYNAGTVGAGGSAAKANADAPVQLVGCTGGPAQITVTPPYNCFWTVDAQSIWSAVSGGWVGARTGIRCTPFDDFDRTDRAPYADVAQHTATAVYLGRQHTQTFRLKAGQTYVAALWLEVVQNVKATVGYWTGWPHLAMWGHTFGHGAF